MKLKIATLALSLVGFSTAYADTLNWNPHLADGYKCTHAQYCTMAGNADIGIVNDTDEAHDYHIQVGLTSDAGAVIGDHPSWTGDIHVPAHDSWGCNVQLHGWVKFNMMGHRQIGLVAHVMGSQQFDREQRGWIDAI